MWSAATLMLSIIPSFEYLNEIPISIIKINQLDIKFFYIIVWNQ